MQQLQARKRTASCNVNQTHRHPSSECLQTMSAKDEADKLTSNSTSAWKPPLSAHSSGMGPESWLRSNVLQQAKANHRSELIM